MQNCFRVHQDKLACRYEKFWYPLHARRCVALNVARTAIHHQPVDVDLCRHCVISIASYFIAHRHAVVPKHKNTCFMSGKPGRIEYKIADAASVAPARWKRCEDIPCSNQNRGCGVPEKPILGRTQVNRRTDINQSINQSILT